MCILTHVEQRFYKRKAELKKIQGPRTTERDRVKVFNSVTEKDVGGFMKNWA